jgi:hypothetical protein
VRSPARNNCVLKGTICLSNNCGRKNTKLKFVKMGNEVKLRFSKDGKNYPHSTEKIANLSIITLAGLKHDSMTTKRILDLHKMGIRQIGHLAQFI